MLLYRYLYVYNYMYMYIYMSCLICCCACALICFTVGEWETFFSIPLYVLTCKVIDNKATLSRANTEVNVLARVTIYCLTSKASVDPSFPLYYGELCMLCAGMQRLCCSRCDVFP